VLIGIQRRGDKIRIYALLFEFLLQSKEHLNPAKARNLNFQFWKFAPDR